MLVTIRNTAVASITLSGTLTNFQPWAPAASATGVIVQAGECATFRVVTPGSAYDVINVTSQNVAIDSTTDRTLTADIAGYGMQVGQLLTITNTKTLGNIVLTAAAVENSVTYPYYTTASTIFVPKDGTVTIELTSASNSNWRVVNFDYPGIQAGAIAFAVSKTTAQTVPTGSEQVVTFDVTDINPQNYFDTATSRYTPEIAGYYNFSATLTVGQVAATTSVAIYKNGVQACRGTLGQAESIATGTITDVIYMNGTTDYVDVRCTTGGGTGPIFTGQTFFSGSLVTQQTLINTTSGIYNVPISADNTVPALLTSAGIGEAVNDLYVITNTATTNVTLTATSFIGYEAFPSQATATDIVMTPGSTLELQNVTIGTGYQIVILNTPINVGSVAFSVSGTSRAINSTYRAVLYPTVANNPQNYYEPTTGRFTPKTAGYYQFDASLNLFGMANSTLTLSLVKNGTITVQRVPSFSSTLAGGCTLSQVVYMNGSTDYVQVFADTSGNYTPTNVYDCTFSGFLTNQTLTEVVGTDAAAFVAKNAVQAIASATLTKITFAAPSVQNDPQSWWNAANNRYIPTIPGYYQVSLLTTYASPQAGTYENQIFKNGSVISNALANPTSGYVSLTPSIVVYMNGSTDYLEAFTYQASGSAQNLEQPGGIRNNFSISLVGANQAVEAVTQTTSAYGQGTWPGNDATRYAECQLDNIKLYQIGRAGFGFATVTGSTQLQGTVQSALFGGGGGSGNIAGGTGSGPWTITTAGSFVWSSSTMSTWTFVFRDLTANISYRATFILQHSFTNSQCFLERIGGQQY
jgi:hypothetical protein